MPHSVQRLLATMVTTTSYGSWLPGDLRGYVDGGVILPHDPKLLERSRQFMKGELVLFTPREQDCLFEGMVCAADEFNYSLLAVSIESWHAHWLVDHGFDSVATMVGRLKTRMRQALKGPSFNRQRIWTAGYDDRLCFDERMVKTRANYIRKHRGWRQLPNEATVH